MKRLEIISAFLVILGTALMLLLISGGSILLSISLSILACIYNPLGMFYFNKIPIRRMFKKEYYEGISVLRLVGAAAGGIVLSILSVGMLVQAITATRIRYHVNCGTDSGKHFMPRCAD